MHPATESRRATYFSVVLLLLLALPHDGFAWDSPFASRNLSPLARLYGLPPAQAAHPLRQGEQEFSAQMSVANNFLRLADGNEIIILDGETYEALLSWRRAGPGPGRARVEWGIEVPLVAHSGGALDAGIDAWHETFGFRDGGRARAPRQQLEYLYMRNGATVFNIDNTTTGIGDVSLQLALPLYEAGDDVLSVRASLKLPTGSSKKLHGSGSTDVAVSFHAAHRLTEDWEAYGALGGVFMSRGDVLANLQRHGAAFGYLGVTYRVYPTLFFQTQLDFHTGLYHSSRLAPLADTAVQVVIGWVWRAGAQHDVHLALMEDLVDFASPDFALLLRSRIRF